MSLTRNPLLAAFALAATLSAPLAFAQSQTDAAATGASVQPASPTDASVQPAAAAPATSNDASAAAASSVSKKSWADVDADKDGNLSKAEASVVPSLGQMFDKADSNADGSLTAAEYKAYVKAQGGKK